MTGGTSVNHGADLPRVITGTPRGRPYRDAASVARTQGAEQPPPCMAVRQSDMPAADFGIPHSRFDLLARVARSHGRSPNNQANPLITECKQMQTLHRQPDLV